MSPYLTVSLCRSFLVTTASLTTSKVAEGLLVISTAWAFLGLNVLGPTQAGLPSHLVDIGLPSHLDEIGLYCH